MEKTKRLAHKECTCQICAARVRAEKAEQDKHIWAKAGAKVVSSKVGWRVGQMVTRFGAVIKTARKVD